jgi:hypothetical protein
VELCGRENGRQIFAWNARLPRSIQGSFTCRKSTTWYRWLYFPSEGRRAEDFFTLKNPTASTGFQPANLGTKGQNATSRPPKPLTHGLGGRLFLQTTLKDGRASNQLPITDIATLNLWAGEEAQHFVNRACLWNTEFNSCTLHNRQLTMSQKKMVIYKKINKWPCYNQSLMHTWSYRVLLQEVWSYCVWALGTCTHHDPMTSLRFPGHSLVCTHQTWCWNNSCKLL